jgi:hypothetical protein
MQHKTHSFADICLYELFSLFEEVTLEACPRILDALCINSILMLPSRLLLAVLSRVHERRSCIFPISVTWHMPMPTNIP